MLDKERIRDNIARIRAELAGRAELVAATKTIPAEIVNYAAECGVRVIGENRVDELLQKYDALDRSRLQIHFIGHLQTNKVKYIVDKVDMIQSLDSISLAREIERRAAAAGRVMPVLVEINLGMEASKSGIPLEETEAFLEEIGIFAHLRVEGLMAIPPKVENPAQNSELFRKIRKKFIDISDKKVDNSNMRFLSIGMSGDYLYALEQGSNMVRIGNAIFGNRTPAADAKQ